MIKNIARLSAVAAGVLLSSSAMAGSFGSADAGTSNTVTPINCIALDNDVTIQLSKGVFAAYTCGTNNVTAAACHTSGTNKSQTIGCSYTVTYDSSDNITGSIPSSSGCASWDGSGSAPTGNTDTFTGRLAYLGGSGGGTVHQTELGATSCGTGSLESLLTP
jgi:hypothetical protein